MKLIAKVFFAASLIAIAIGSAFAQGPGNFSNVTSPLFTVTPTNPVPQITSATVSPTVQGSTAYYYWIVVNNGTTKSLPSGAFTVPNGPATLSSNVYNVIQFTPLLGTYTYDILRTSTSATPTGACNCAVAIGVSTGTVNDQSNSLQNYTVVATQTNCTISNQVSNGLPALLSGCPFGGGSSIVSVASYGSFANAKVSSNVGVFNNGTQYIAYAPLSANLFSQADVGKTLWVNNPAQGNTALPQGIVLSVTVSGSNQVVTTTTISGQSQCNPMGGCVAVWGNDDTPAFTAAAAAANTIGGTLYIPCGMYILTAPALDENAINGYDIQGANELCVTLIPSPQITPNGSDASVVNLTSVSGKTVSGLQINGEGAMMQHGANPIFALNQGRSLLASNVQIIDVATNGAPQFFVSVTHSTIVNVTSRDPAQVGGAGLNSGDMCNFTAVADVTVIGILCSNSVGENSADLRVVNVNPEDTGSGLEFVDGIIDECGESPNGSDGALSACAIITASVHVSFNSTILWASNAGTPGAALSVDGTSEVNLDNGVSIGPYGTESGQNAIVIASGGILRMEHTNVRANGAGVFGISNSGTLYFGGGNNVTVTGGASQFTGNVPIFVTTQIGAVTAGHVASWGSGGLGQLVDGGDIAQVIQSTARTTLASDISLSANTPTTVVADTVTMPSSGCPCRVLAQYTIYLATNNWTGTSWLTDGTNIFASGQTTGVGTNVTAISASEISQTTYANSATPTFTLTFEDNGTGGDIKAAAAQGNATNTYLTLTVLTSN